MIDKPFILAATDDGGITKIIFGVIFVIIWGISALMSWIAKQKEAERRRRLQQEMERGMSPLPPPPMQQMPSPRGVRPPPVRTAPQPPPRMRVPPQPQAKRRFPVKAPTRRPVPVRAEVIEEAVILPTPVPTPPPQQGSTRRPVGAGATAIRAWLTPATLRQQFILTEVLQPPVAMREPRD